jgi:hypothetical protein
MKTWKRFVCSISKRGIELKRTVIGTSASCLIIKRSEIGVPERFIIKAAIVNHENLSNPLSGKFHEVIQYLKHSIPTLSLLQEDLYVK